MTEDEEELAAIQKGIAQLDAGLSVNLEEVLQKAEAAGVKRQRQTFWESLPSNRRPGREG
ncbi:hypothetical protein [Mesorhizobium sp. A623]